ncbi:MAG: hypothetical protein H7288_18105 [Kineosporiaceae bacterium]|nr:hypothetical protein [Aeromicrobium sp.]
MTGAVIPPHSRGRTSISRTALTRVVAAVSGKILGVSAHQVRVELSDDGGRLQLTIHSPVRMVSLDRVVADPNVIGRAGGTLMERGEHAQQHIRSQVTAMTGYRIAQVIVTMTRASIRTEARVR